MSLAVASLIGAGCGALVTAAVFMALPRGESVRPVDAGGAERSSAAGSTLTADGAPTNPVASDGFAASAGPPPPAPPTPPSIPSPPPLDPTLPPPLVSCEVRLEKGPGPESSTRILVSTSADLPALWGMITSGQQRTGGAVQIANGRGEQIVPGYDSAKSEVVIYADPSMDPATEACRYPN
jgi:hypothetical protein